MATAAFKSTTKRTPHGISSSETSTRTSASHRRSRSLSRFSHPTPEPRGKFVNTVRGSGVSEISLDDLACEFFDSDLLGEGRAGGRSAKRGSDGTDDVRKRRGRSVSRHRRSGSGSVCNSVAGGKRVGSECNSRRRRSLSVARGRVSDSEQSDLDHTQNSRSRANLKSIGGENDRRSSFYNKPAAQICRQGLRRSFSQKDLVISDDHSSQSSVLTDEEGKYAHTITSGNERTTEAFNAGKKPERRNGNVNDGRLYEAMRKELRHAVEEMKEEFEHAMLKTGASSIASSDDLQLSNSYMLQTASTSRRNSISKMEQHSANYKQDLRAMMLGEEHGREQSDVRNLLPVSANNVIDISPVFRDRSNDRSNMSERLTEEAEKYIEDFISNVEDTDISSLDGEISDTSSMLGGVLKLESYQSPTTSKSLPAELDGINLPWLQWETSNDASLSYKRKLQLPITPRALACNAVQGPTTLQDTSNCSSSSRGSWSPALVDATPSSNGEDVSSRHRHVRSCGTLQSSRRLQVDVGQYLKLESSEDLIFEKWKQHQRISSGCLLLCNRMLF